MKRLLYILFAILVLGSCSRSLPSVSGKAGEVVIVMDRPDWEGDLGNLTREILGADIPYLFQKEPYYSLVNVVPSDFEGLYKAHRNVLVFNTIDQNLEPSVRVRQDIWSTPQCVIEVNARNTLEAMETVLQSGSDIIKAFEEAEKARVIANAIQYEDEISGKQVAETFGGAPHFPAGYKVRKTGGNFAWIANDRDGCYQDILIFRYPAAGLLFPEDEAAMISRIDDALRENVPGMFANSYMTTSKYFPITMEQISGNGRGIIQTRGMWEVANDYMQGPFVAHTFLTPDGYSAITAFALVYAPRFDKRSYLRQVEAILHSWEWSANENI